MKVYLAAPFAKQQQMEEIAEELRSMGHEVLSTWHKPSIKVAVTHMEKVVAANIDSEDLNRSDTIIAFTEPENASPYSSGGRHVEWGMSMASFKLRLVVGPAENVYYAWAHHRTETWEEMRDFIRRVPNEQIAKYAPI